MEWPQKIIRIWKLIISPIFLTCKHCLSLMHLPIRNWTVSNPNYCLDLSVIHASVQLQLSHFNSKLLPGSSHLLLRFFLNFFMEWPQKIIRIWKLIISPIFPKCKHCLSLMHLPIHSSIRPQLSKSDAAAAGSTRWWLQRGSVQTQVKHSEADGGLRGVVGGGLSIYIYI